MEHHNIMIKYHGKYFCTTCFVFHVLTTETKTAETERQTSVATVLCFIVVLFGTYYHEPFSTF